VFIQEDPVMTDVHVHIRGFPDSDDEERADLAWRLREDLLDADVGGVSSALADTPPGVKGAALAWDKLIVGPVRSLPGFVSVVLRWMQRHPEAAITLEIDGDTLALDTASESERHDALIAFASRHDAH
jgi:hypothetical protein